MESGQGTSAVFVRLSAIVAISVAVVALGFVLLRSSDEYVVFADFVNASQLVEGNQVKVAGEPVGTITGIEITDDNQARVEMHIEDPAFQPLRRGTVGVVRLQSLSGQANRYVDLRLGEGRAPAIADGGRIGAESTEAAVDLDQLFNTFDPVARVAVGKTFKLFEEFNAGSEEQAQEALRYLNPAMASSAALFREVNRSRPALERFIVEDARLVSDLAAQDDVIADLVQNLSGTMDALNAERDDLGEAIEVLPAFLRRSNTTFVNLRAAFDDLQPLVDEAKPVVRDKVIALFDELRPFARDAEPTVRDLSRTIRRPGEGNDLIEFLRKQPPVAQIAVAAARRNGERRPGAFAQLQDAMEGITPQLGFFRPYAPELTGWFDDFSTTGAEDALNDYSRAGLAFSGFTFGPTVGESLELLPVPPELRDEVLGANTIVGTNDPCPGSNERGAIFKPTPDFPCDETEVPPGR